MIPRHPFGPPPLPPPPPPPHSQSQLNHPGYYNNPYPTYPHPHHHRPHHHTHIHSLPHHPHSNSHPHHPHPHPQSNPHPHHHPQSNSHLDRQSNLHPQSNTDPNPNSHLHPQSNPTPNSESTSNPNPNPQSNSNSNSDTQPNPIIPPYIPGISGNPSMLLPPITGMFGHTMNHPFTNNVRPDVLNHPSVGHAESDRTADAVRPDVLDHHSSGMESIIRPDSPEHHSSGMDSIVRPELPVPLSSGEKEIIKKDQVVKPNIDVATLDEPYPCAYIHPSAYENGHYKSGPQMKREEDKSNDLAVDNLPVQSTNSVIQRKADHGFHLQDSNIDQKDVNQEKNRDQNQEKNNVNEDTVKVETPRISTQDKGKIPMYKIKSDHRRESINSLIHLQNVSSSEDEHAIISRPLPEIVDVSRSGISHEGLQKTTTNLVDQKKSYSGIKESSNGVESSDDEPIPDCLLSRLPGSPPLMRNQSTDSTDKSKWTYVESCSDFSEESEREMDSEIDNASHVATKDRDDVHTPYVPLNQNLINGDDVTSEKPWNTWQDFLGSERLDSKSERGLTDQSQMYPLHPMYSRVPRASAMVDGACLSLSEGVMGGDEIAKPIDDVPVRSLPEIVNSAQTAIVLENKDTSTNNVPVNPPGVKLRDHLIKSVPMGARPITLPQNPSKKRDRPSTLPVAIASCKETNANNDVLKKHIAGYVKSTTECLQEITKQLENLPIHARDIKCTIQSSLNLDSALDNKPRVSCVSNFSVSTTPPRTTSTTPSTTSFEHMGDSDEDDLLDFSSASGEPDAHSTHTTPVARSAYGLAPADVEAEAITPVLPTTPKKEHRDTSVGPMSPVDEERFINRLLENPTNTSATTTLLNILKDEHVQLDSVLGLKLLDLAADLRLGGSHDMTSPFRKRGKQSMSTQTKKDRKCKKDPFVEISKKLESEEISNIDKKSCPSKREESKKHKDITESAITKTMLMEKLNEFVPTLNAIASAVGLNVVDEVEDGSATVETKHPFDKSSISLAANSQSRHTHLGNPVHEPTETVEPTKKKRETLTEYQKRIDTARASTKDMKFCASSTGITSHGQPISANLQDSNQQPKLTNDSLLSGSTNKPFAESKLPMDPVKIDTHRNGKQPLPSIQIPNGITTIPNINTSNQSVEPDRGLSSSTSAPSSDSTIDITHPIPFMNSWPNLPQAPLNESEWAEMFDIPPPWMNPSLQSKPFETYHDQSSRLHNPIEWSPPQLPNPTFKLPNPQPPFFGIDSTPFNSSFPWLHHVETNPGYIPWDQPHLSFPHFGQNQLGQSSQFYPHPWNQLLGQVRSQHTAGQLDMTERFDRSDPFRCRDLFRGMSFVPCQMGGDQFGPLNQMSHTMGQNPFSQAGHSMGPSNPLPQTAHSMGPNNPLSQTIHSMGQNPFSHTGHSIGPNNPLPQTNHSTGPKNPLPQTHHSNVGGSRSTDVRPGVGSEERRTGQPYYAPGGMPTFPPTLPRPSGMSEMSTNPLTFPRPSGMSEVPNFPLTFPRPAGMSEINAWVHVRSKAAVLGVLVDLSSIKSKGYCLGNSVRPFDIQEFGDAQWDQGIMIVLYKDGWRCL
ncbi:hypothetical protein TREMEDRAFT_65148 [Tremella mesenterica DSM 1558]|uniref:uncharacterized protein n=1 Tax=Tremella mesenterica (strain ATCC 24925 / CBS 8224 / DSM 1558 / NBRC 9311 / NRRL Y-6157 / RJB 2259-6 / UBC 559-6) TaxID=578456 RepID=UPI00032CAF8D|nr:uncharacterized protein TREMEDRAFT_65148 [Tremella mesenterica DSM 1558]EIW66752.1 hypothetical protein TREMEDRAFT_65148 [Tremella mesenterica DSM 1558]